MTSQDYIGLSDIMALSDNMGGANSGWTFLETLGLDLFSIYDNQDEDNLSNPLLVELFNLTS